ncbi:hypothetical protein HW555_004693 [Spodoptera exigua]|uniref:Uncharacterized protein n=1 Tax=Spodoptera exigua TaxID=7107 RepID=A0A835GIM9_SPOEX|nr:hypothetical protein HW555_004693 [Spodoptera exigua]
MFNFIWQPHTLIPASWFIFIFHTGNSTHKESDINLNSLQNTRTLPYIPCGNRRRDTLRLSRKLRTAHALSVMSGTILRQRAPENAGDRDARIDRHFVPVITKVYLLHKYIPVNMMRFLPKSGSQSASMCTPRSMNELKSRTMIWRISSGSRGIVSRRDRFHEIFPPKSDSCQIPQKRYRRQRTYTPGREVTQAMAGIIKEARH